MTEITGSEADRAERLNKLIGKIGKINVATTFAEKGLPEVRWILCPDDGYRWDYKSDRYVYHRSTRNKEDG